MNNDKLLLSELEAAERLSIGRSTLRKLSDAGRLAPVYVGRKTLYVASDLEVFAASLRHDAAHGIGDASADARRRMHRKTTP